MRTSVSPANKGSEDVKPGDQTHASGTGHHVKHGAKKCNKQTFLLHRHFRSLFFF